MIKGFFYLELDHISEHLVVFLMTYSYPELSEYFAVFKPKAIILCFYSQFVSSN